MGELSPSRHWLLLWIGLTVLALGSCASSSSQSSGAHHTVRPGENLYRIGLRYGVTSEQIARANGIRDVTAIAVGTRLRIPKASQSRAARGSSQASSSSKKNKSRSTAASKPGRSELRRKARAEAKREAALSFAWPVRGRLTSGFGMRRGRPHEGIDMAANKGTPIIAAESGKVIHSGRLGDYGNVVILKHAGNFRSVYAHARKTHVRKGQFVERGDRIAEVGKTGRATGPHLHFEIRRKDRPRDPVLYLP